MQLTRFTDFSLRVLMYLTHQDRTELATINEIAAQFDIPRSHLVKIVTHLVKLNWVCSIRGRNGGIKLAIPAEQLRLGQAIKQLENHTYLINCYQQGCKLNGQCHLQGILHQGMQHFYQYLDQYSLADAVSGKTGDLIAQLYFSKK